MGDRHKNNSQEIYHIDRWIEYDDEAVVVAVLAELMDNYFSFDTLIYQVVLVLKDQEMEEQKNLMKFYYS